jgi:hypothetical protein
MENQCGNLARRRIEIVSYWALKRASNMRSKSTDGNFKTTLNFPYRLSV